MCLAIPGKIISIEGKDFERSGKVNFGGIMKDVNLAYVPEAKVNDYVIVHVGFAISILDEEEANKVFEYLKEMDEIESLGSSESSESLESSEDLKSLESSKIRKNQKQ